jgi:predicted small secreted protein
MKSVLLRSLLMLMAGMFTVTHLTACNTVEGAGQDAQNAGEAVEDLADDAKD